MKKRNAGFLQGMPGKTRPRVPVRAFAGSSPHAHVVTATTFKNLYGFVGGLILFKETDLERKLDNAVFYGFRGSDPECNCGQGCLGEAPKPDCAVYGSQVVANACTLAKTLFENRIDVIIVGTDTSLINLRNLQLI